MILCLIIKLCYLTLSKDNFKLINIYEIRCSKKLRYCVFCILESLILTMRNRYKKLLIRHESIRYLLSDPGFCVRNTSGDNPNFMLTIPPPYHFTFVNNSLYKVVIAVFRKLRYLCARALCLDKVSLRGLLLLHRGCPDACCCLHLLQQQNRQNYSNILTYFMV